MKIKEVIAALELVAPLPLQEDYDNAGLQVGLTEAEVSGALLCLDVTEAVVTEAAELGCNLIVAHHPLIFHRLSQVTNADYVQRCVMQAIRQGITIVAMHTNLDNARGGVNFKMAERMGLHGAHFLAPKVVGSIEGGSGLIGQLAAPLSATEFIKTVKEQFGVACVMTNELLQRPIQSVALCGGAGSFLLSDAIAAGADAFITGEMHYHEYFGHEQEIQICVIGHYESEQFTQQLLQEIINRECPEVKTYITTVRTNPIHYYQS